jgi:hypothetical protein
MTPFEQARIEEQLWRDQMAGVCNRVKERPQPDHAHVRLLALGWSNRRVGQSVLYERPDDPGVRVHYRPDRWYPYLVEGWVTARVYTPEEAHERALRQSGVVRRRRATGFAASALRMLQPIAGRS